MRSKGQIVAFLFVLFSGGIAFCQTVKEKPAAPPLQVFFGKYSADVVNTTTMAELLKADSIFVVNQKGNGHCKVVSFSICSFDSGRIVTEAGFGNHLSKKQRGFIASLRRGQTITIEKIALKCDGQDKVFLKSKFTFAVRK